MKKQSLSILLIVFFICSAFFPVNVLSFEKIGMDHVIEDSADDLWHVASKDAEVESIEKLQGNNSIDLRKLTISNSSGYYLIQLEMEENFNQSLFEMYNGSHISVWIYVNNRVIEYDKRNAHLYCTISNEYSEGFVFISGEELLYENSSSALVEGNTIVWKIPEINLTRVIDITKDISLWNATAWSFLLQDWNSTTSSGEYIVDLVADPEMELEYKRTWKKINGNTINGFPIYLIISCVLIYSFGIIHYKKKVGDTD